MPQEVEEQDAIDLVEDARQDNIDAMDAALIASKAKEKPPESDFDFSDVEGATLGTPQTEEVVKANEAKAAQEAKSETTEATAEKSEAAEESTESKPASEVPVLRDDQIMRAAQLGIPLAQIVGQSPESVEQTLQVAQRYAAAWHAQQQFARQQQQAQQAPQQFDADAMVKSLVDKGWDEEIAKAQADSQRQLHEMRQQIAQQNWLLQQQQAMSQSEVQRRANEDFNRLVSDTVNKSLGDVVSKVVGNDPAKLAAIQRQTLQLFQGAQSMGLTPPPQNALIEQAVYTVFGKEIAEHAAGKKADQVREFRKGATDRAVSTKPAADTTLASVKARFSERMSRAGL